MDTQVIFKSKMFGGFDKHEVINYIDEISSKAKQAEDNLNQKIQDMTAAGAELYRQISKFEEQISTLEKQVEDERTTIELLTSQVKNLTDDLYFYKENADKHEIAYKLECERTRKLLEENKALIERSQKYDDAAIEVGALIVEGKQSAKRIVEKAQTQAHNLQNFTRSSAQSVNVDLTSFRNELENLKRDLLKTMNHMIAKIEVLDSSAQEMAVYIDNALDTQFIPSDEEVDLEFVPEAVSSDRETVQSGKVERFFRPAANV